MLRDITTLNDAQKALRDLDDRVAKLFISNIDMKGRRVVNAGASLDKGDYITRAEVESAFADLNSRVESVKAEIERIKARLTAGGI
jgi:hypothetical protein